MNNKTKAGQWGVRTIYGQYEECVVMHDTKKKALEDLRRQHAHYEAALIREYYQVTQ